MTVLCFGNGTRIVVADASVGFDKHGVEIAVHLAATVGDVLVDVIPSQNDSYDANKYASGHNRRLSVQPPPKKSKNGNRVSRLCLAPLFGTEGLETVSSDEESDQEDTFFFGCLAPFSPSVRQKLPLLTSRSVPGTSSGVPIPKSPLSSPGKSLTFGNYWTSMTSLRSQSRDSLADISGVDLLDYDFPDSPKTPLSEKIMTLRPGETMVDNDADPHSTALIIRKENNATLVAQISHIMYYGFAEGSVGSVRGAVLRRHGGGVEGVRAAL
eukprot:gene5102-6207_t